MGQCWLAGCTCWIQSPQTLRSAVAASYPIASMATAAAARSHQHALPPHVQASEQASAERAFLEMLGDSSQPITRSTDYDDVEWRFRNDTRWGGGGVVAVVLCSKSHACQSLQVALASAC
jgi:hypothetical protein